METVDSKKPQRNIALELFEAWQLAKRQGDPDALAALLEVSRPTIDKALIYGYVAKEEMGETITKFFQDRLAREREAALKLTKAIAGTDFQEAIEKQ